VKVAKLFPVLSLVAVALIAISPTSYAQAAPAAASPSKLPKGWDSRIPLPPDAELIDSTVPKTGVVYSADFSVKGKYQDLVDFYETQLPKNGFVLGPKVAMAKRQVYNRSFSHGGNLNSVVLTPNLKDPSKMNLHFAWSSGTEKKK